MEYVLDYWFVVIPAALGLAWLVSAWVIWGSTRKAIAEAARADGLDPEHDDLRDWQMHTRWRWVCTYENALLVYHFPVIIPAALISRDNSGPRMTITIPLQACVYSAILWGISLLFN